MKILALEFSSSKRSVAVWAGGQVRGRAEETQGRDTHALAMIESALSAAGSEREEIDSIAVGLGPGSYAGIRIAIALAQGWQLARPVKLLGVSSADCVAAQAQAAGWFGRMELVMDAQRHGFYCASYEIAASGWRETAPFRLLAPESMGRSGPGAEPTFVVRPDTRGWRSQDERVLCPDAGMLAKLAAGRTEFVAGESLAPIYLVESEFVKAPPPRVIC